MHKSTPKDLQARWAKQGFTLKKRDLGEKGVELKMYFDGRDPCTGQSNYKSIIITPEESKDPEKVIKAFRILRARWTSSIQRAKKRGNGGITHGNSFTANFA